MSDSQPSIPDLDASLSFDDSQALDALVAAEFDIDRVPVRLRDRAGKLLSIMDGLSSGPADSHLAADARIHAGMSRINAFDFNPESIHLSPADEDSLEALVQSGMNPAHVAGGMRTRAEAQLRVLSLLDVPAFENPAAQRDALIDRSMRLIERETLAQQQRMVVRPPTERAARGKTWRFSDLISVAAVLMVGAAVLWPVMSQARDSARRAACLSNNASLAGAFSMYSNDHRESLPMASASLGGLPWWNVGRNVAESNSANLYTLNRAGYSKVESMACSGNSSAVTRCDDTTKADWDRFEDVSYSFLNLFGRPGVSSGSVWHSTRPIVLLADRSAVVVRARAGALWIDVTENSPNHNASGQTVLLSDGSAKFLRTPDFEGDNIWIPVSIEDALRRSAQLHRGGRAEPLRGVETPSSATDIFLGP